MNKKNKINIFLLSLFILLALVFSFVFVVNNSKVTSNIANKYLSKIDSISGYKFNFDGINVVDRHSFNISNLVVYDDNSVVVSVDQINFKYSVLNAIKLFVGFINTGLDIEIINPVISYSFSSSNDGQTSNLSQVYKLLKRLNGSLLIKNLNIDLGIDDNSFGVNGLNFKLFFRHDFSIQYALLYFDSMDFNLDKQNTLGLSRAELSFNNEVVSISADSFSSSYANISSISGSGSFKNGLLNTKLTFESVSGDFNSLFYETDIVELGIEYDSKNSNNYFNIQLNLPTIVAEYENNSVVVNDVLVNGNTDIKFSNLIVSSAIGDVLVETDFLNFEKLNLNDFNIYLQYGSNSNNSLNLNCNVNGYSSFDYIGDFNFRFSAGTNFDSFEDLLNYENYRNSYVSIPQLNCSALSGDNRIYVSSDDMNLFGLDISLSNNFNAYSTYDLKSKDSDIRLYLSAFKIAEYNHLFNIIEQYAGNYFDVDSQIDGSIIYHGNLDLSSLTGRASVNLVGQNFIISEEKQSVAVSFEATSTDSDVSVNSLAITAMGKRLSYSGTVNLNSLYPEGSLSLQDSITFDEIASISFKRDINNEGYSFDAIVNSIDSIKFDGHISLTSLENLIADINIVTPRITYPVSISADFVSLKASLLSGESLLEFSIAENNLDLIGTISNLPVSVSDTITAIANTNLNVVYNLDSSLIDVSLDNLSVKISEILTVGMDFSFNNQQVSLKDILLTYDNQNYLYKGGVSVNYDSLSSLIDFKEHSFNILIDLIDEETHDYVVGSFNDNVFSLDANLKSSINTKLSLLGSLDSGFFADISYSELSLTSEYRDGVLTIDEGNGTLKSLNLNQISLDIDLNSRTLFGSVNFENDKQNRLGVVKQGGTLELEARLESLALGALNLAGIDAEADFTLSLVDCYLGDGFKIKDTDINVTFSRSKIELNGDLINGKILPQDKYLELSINKEFLFGFNLEGYFDDQLELYFTDLYFPIQIIDQFINLVEYTTVGGVIEGDLLINGSIEDPTFYGMLYAQSFEMGLLYLPDQVLSAKSVVISAVDHDFIISTTPIVGHSSADGRYYNGDVDVILKFARRTVDSFNIHVDTHEDPIDLWIPLLIDETNDLNIRGDVVGTLDYYYKDNTFGLYSVIDADNAEVSFRIENKPEWMVSTGFYIDVDVVLTTGKNVDFYYPTRNNSIVNFTVNDGETVEILFDSHTLELSALGEFSINSGRITYINNDFNITGGKCRLSEDLNGDFKFNIDLSSKIREYDEEGNRMDIFLNLDHASLDNISPRFSSIPSYSETDIIQFLASSVFPTKNNSMSINQIANIAYVTAKTVSDIMLTGNNKEYNLNSVIRDSLDLDIFTAKSAILRNIILNSILVSDKDTSLLAKYLNGTSIFAGKYLGDNLFARMTLLLKESSGNGKNRSEFGHFLTSDLNLDVEFSIDWDNPIGEFSIFTSPQELSIYDFLDNIGFSVTKRINF